MPWRGGQKGWEREGIPSEGLTGVVAARGRLESKLVGGGLLWSASRGTNGGVTRKEEAGRAGGAAGESVARHQGPVYHLEGG